ncbi:hypothetical protein I4U23_017538 [Adineta vaga]|nr:hypothetical protein I4U23_017538 [Adineta vaga]
MTSSNEEHSFHTEYINPMIDQYSSQQENPLVLMAKVCNNIGKDLSISVEQISPSFKHSSKQRKSLKRISSTKKTSSSMNSLVLHHFNRIYSSSSSYSIDSILSSPFICNSTNTNGKYLINPNYLFSQFSFPLYNSSL